ncbi:MAG: FAD-dependent oxidoreductase, partial [Pseudomonadota bacterium]
EQKSGLIGIYEKANPNTVWEDHCPWDAENELFAPDYDRVMPWLENALERMPVLAGYGIKRDVHGAISHPPDGNPLIGPAPGVNNYWCCCGTQIGIGWGPGLTRELARWMVHGAADISMREFDPRRFGDYADKSFQVTKAKEDYCLRHEIPFPHFNRLAARPVKPGPLYERLKDQGAVFEEVYGHERPRWFAPAGTEAKDQYSFKRNDVHDIVGREVGAVRSAVGIMDVTAFTKVQVSGSDAATYLDALIANRLPKHDGSAILAHLLNARGRIEIETTVVRLDANSYYLVCAAFFEQRLLDHLNRYKAQHQVEISNLSSGWSALALQGPASRDVLQANTTAALNNKNFRWLSAQTIDVAGQSVLAVRMSYSGELGWELHMANDAAVAVYDALWQTGQAHGMVNYGSFAMNIMRMEKGFKGAGELTNEVTLPEADVMRFVTMDKPEFVGKEKTQQSADEPLPWVC